MNNKNWLPHLTNEIVKDAKSNKFCAYLIALEGWRRGLTLTYHSDKVTKKNIHSPGLRYSLSLDKKTHTFYKARGDKVKGKAFSIGSNKIATKEWLSEHGIPVVDGKKFSKESSSDEIINFALKLGFPIVLKPVVGAQGKGVIPNIDNLDYLKKSLTYVREELNSSDIIIERHFEGKEFRVYVIEDNVVAVINRVPANVTGDGLHTINQLIHLKNKERKKNPRLRTCLIKVDFEIKNILDKLGLSLDSVPEAGQLIFLREKSNVSTGGDSIELTDEFPAEIKNIAISALKSIPDFPHGGVDIIYNANKPINEAAVVLELSPTPQIGSLVFPMEGKSRDVPAAIIDYYFPETKNKKDQNANVYFDLNSLLEPLMSKSASEVTASPAPLTEIYAKKYVISGKVQGVGYRKWVRKKAIESDLYGYAKNLINGDVAVVVAGEKENVINFKKVCNIGPKACNVISISESIWDKPIKIGFEIMTQPKKKMNPKQKQKQTTNNKKKVSFFKSTLRKLLK
ncbi:acylphosphatase [Virgibacillus oceani]|uniref:acylphosphatase n=1 Tax=Virgibacillus oceani TaxID=1479511 RepID=A0A917HCD4_9BACI|nr:acylphosphatase [Virgibacillus oceani]GGG73425.1 hypothetical protein GCM10011398_17350 [Virgibacillus oceani]